MKERDEARDALAKVSIGTGAASGDDEMQIDSQGMPDHVVEKINRIHQEYVTLPIGATSNCIRSNISQAVLYT